MLLVHYAIIKAFRACWELQALISTLLQTFPFSCICCWILFFFYEVSFSVHQRNYSFFYLWTCLNTIDATNVKRSNRLFCLRKPFNYLKDAVVMVSHSCYQMFYAESVFISEDGELNYLLHKHNTDSDQTVVIMKHTYALRSFLSSISWRAGGLKAVWSGAAGLLATEPAGAQVTHCRKKPFTWIPHQPYKTCGSNLAKWAGLMCEWERWEGAPRSGTWSPGKSSPAH